MSTLLFVALVSGDPAAGYRATVPDLPECACDAVDLGGLLTAARQAVRDRLQALAEAGEPWPEPTPFEQVQAPEGTRPVLLDVAVDDPPVRVNISVGEQLLARLDAAAEARGMTRSGFIAQAVRVSLGERGAGTADFDGASRRVQEELSALGRRINDSIGPDSAFSRRMAEVDDLFYEGVRRAADSVSAAVTRRRATPQNDTPNPAAPDA